MSITLSDEVQAWRVLHDLTELVLLDALWTEHLDSGRSNSDLEPLEQIVADMDRLLATLPSVGEWLAGVLDAEPEGVAGAFGRTAQRMRDGTNHVAADWLEDHQQSVSFVRRSCVELERTATKERADLQDKIATIRTSEPTPGDLSQAGLCAIYGALVGAVVVATLIQPESAVLESVVAASATAVIAEQCL